jgi:hypothetical protein
MDAASNSCGFDITLSCKHRSRVIIKREGSRNGTNIFWSPRKKKDVRVLFISLLSCNLLPYTAECNKQLSPTNCCLHTSWKTAVDITLLYTPGSRTNVKVKDEEANSKCVVCQSQQTGAICPRFDHFHSLVTHLNQELKNL